MEFLDRLRALPGVEAAAIVTAAPFTGSSNGQSFSVEGVPIPPDGQLPIGNLHRVSSGYFDAMQIPLLEGRDFNAADRDGGSGAVIVDSDFVRKFFPGESPLGRHIRWGSVGKPLEIVGVAGSAKHFGIDQDEITALYIPFAQDPWNDAAYVVRTIGDSPLAVLPAAREKLRQLDATLPISHPQPMRELVRKSYWPRTIISEIFSFFSALAVALAAVGIAGTMAYMAAQRRREIGVRMALGALPGDVQLLILKRGMKLAGAGLAAGIAASLIAARFLSSLLFGVRGADPLTLGCSVLFFAAVALAACYVPARRAAKVDPMAALRAE